MIASAILIVVAGMIGRQSAERLVSTQSGNMSYSADSWVEYSPADRSFSVRLPDTPDLETSSKTVSGVEVEYEVYTVSTDNDWPVYSVAVANIPTASVLFTETEAKNFLQSMIRGTARKGSWAVASQSAMDSTNACFSMNFTSRGQGDAQGLYLTGRATAKYANRIYMVMILSNSLYPANRDMFLDSFRVR